MNDIILFAHPTLGVLATMAAVWVLVEAINASEANQGRIQAAACTVAGLVFATYVVGGYWYVNFYAPEKAAILKGPWPFAHNLFMESKEHIFFGLLVLAILLPFVARQKLASNWSAKVMIMLLAVLVIGNSLAMEGAGAVINHGAKLAYQLAGVK